MTLRRLAAGLLVLVLGGCAASQGGPAGSAAATETPAAPPREPVPAGVSTAAPARPRIAADDVADRIVAVVNNDAITLGELQEMVAMMRQDGRARPAGSDEALLRQMLGRLIDARLQLQEAERQNITVDDAEIEAELAERMKRFGASSRAELERMAEAQGLSLEAIKRRVRDSLRVQKVVRRKVALRVTVTDQEIDRYLEENRAKLEVGLGYHARHILIVPEGSDDAAWEAARIKAELILAELRDGADFAELARKHSRDASAKDGGDLGPLKRGELAQEIEARILALEPGQVTAPFRSALGYHIFRLESKEELQGERLQRVRQQARDILFRQKYEARLDAWLREIKERAIIEVRM